MAAYQELRAGEAVEHVRKAATLVEEPYARLRIVANQNEALYNHVLGNSRVALKILQQAHDECQRLKLASQIPKIRMLEANIHLAMGHYREAISDVDRCAAAMRETGTYSLQLEAYIGRFRGLAMWFLGDRETGLRLLEAAREPAQQFSTATGIEVTLLWEYYNLLSDNPATSVDESHLPGKNDESETRLTFLALQAVRALRRDDFAGARRHAIQLRGLAEKHGLLPWTVTGCFLLSIAMSRARDGDRTNNLVRDGLSRLQQIGWRTYPMANDTITAFAIVRAWRLGLEHELCELLRSDERDIDLTPAFDKELGDKKLTSQERLRLWDAAARLSVRGLSAHLERHGVNASATDRNVRDRYRDFLESCVLPPLSINMLGGLSITSQGRQIRFSRATSRLLLLHLLIAHPRAIHEEELIEQLWPESDPAKGRSSLHTSVKDLRKALDPYAPRRGRAYITYADQHYGLELSAESHVDYLKFTTLCEDCLRRTASGSSPVDDMIVEFRKALMMYRGPLLPMFLYEPFTIEARERLQSLFQRGSLKLSELLISRKGYEEATSVLDTALGYDPLWTDGVRLLLQAQVMSGKTLMAMRAYRRFESCLREELGISPDESMREHFDSLMRMSSP
jgi:DNA-binding SARP family transcriptional activator